MGASTRLKVPEDYLKPLPRRMTLEQATFYTDRFFDISIPVEGLVSWYTNGILKVYDDGHVVVVERDDLDFAIARQFPGYQKRDRYAAIVWTVPRVAEEFDLSPRRVREMLESGEIEGKLVRHPLDKRSQWIVNPMSIKKLHDIVGAQIEAVAEYSRTHIAPQSHATKQKGESNA